MLKVFPKSCLFIVCKLKQCLLSVNLKLFLMQTEQQTQQRQIFNTRRGRFHTEKSSGARTPTWNSYSTAQATKRETASTNSGAEGTSLDECRMLKYFTSKWKRFTIISLNLSANIAVTKHALLADEFIPYRPRLVGFHFLHVNAMKCIYVGVSLSKRQSVFWKISLNSRFIRLEGFHNKISTYFPVCSTWPSGKAFGPVRRRSTDRFRVRPFSLRFFSFLLFFLFLSFSFHFRYNSFVMFLYIAYNF